MDDAKKLLDLQAEYIAAKDDTWSQQFPGEPARTPEAVAAEYGQALKAFLSA